VVLNKYKNFLETDKWDTSLEKDSNIISFIAEVHVLNQRELIFEFLFDTPPHHSEQTHNIKQSILDNKGKLSGIFTFLFSISSASDHNSNGNKLNMEALSRVSQPWPLDLAA
jgi:hypothetical protein